MQYAYNAVGVGEARLLEFKVGASCAAGIIVQPDDSNGYGEIIPTATTAATDALGLTLNAGTYSTTQGATEGTCMVVVNPFAVLKAKISGGATENTALSSSTYHVLTNTSASAGGTTMTATHAGTNFKLGTMFMLTGANAGKSRILTTITSTTSVACTVPFPSAIAVGDKALILPYAKGTHKVQTTTAFTQADGSIATGTGVDGAVVELEIPTPVDTTNPEAFVYFVVHDHCYNPVD